MAERAVVLAAHGSPDPRAQREAGELAEAVRAARPDLSVTLAFLEGAGTDLASGLDEAAGIAGEVALVPLFLNSGRHLHEDLPTALSAAGARHPGHRLRMTDPVGLDPAVPALLGQRLDEVRDRLPEGPVAAVIAAHGARDPRAAEEIHHLAEHLVTRSGAPAHPAFTGIGEPDLHTVLGRLAEQGYAGAAILPHLLFSGPRHDRLVDDTDAAPLPVAVARPYGPDPALRDAVLARLGQ